MKNNLGIIYIDLGEQNFSNSDITNTLNEKAKKLLLDIAHKISTSKDSVGVNNITKLIYIHILDINALLETYTFASISTSDSGVNCVRISFSAINYDYDLIVDSGTITLDVYQKVYVE